MKADRSINTNRISRTSAAVLLLLAVAVLFSCCLWKDADSNSHDQIEAPRYLEAAQPNNIDDHSETLRMLKETEDIWFSMYRNKDMYAELKEKHKHHLDNTMLDQSDNTVPLSICGRQTNVGTTKDLALLQHFNMDNTCPGANSKDLLLLQGNLAHGRTGNNLIEFLHALQLARDKNFQLGITSRSWAFELLHTMWFNASHDDDWEAKFEKAFCVKIFHPKTKIISLEGWNLVPQGLNSVNSVIISKYLFNYMSKLPLDEYIASQSRFIQTLFRHSNTAPDDMCSGISTIFGNDENDVLYTAIHNRHLEGAPGIRLMKRMARGSGCHSTAALDLKPEYIKAILRPLGMLKNPIVLITDGENPDVAQRLLEDPEIGPMLRLVPESASWIGGDLTLGIMSNVFIGNPASSFSGFIARSRIALGFGQNHLFRARNGNKEWVPTCGDACIFDKGIMGNMC